MPAERSSNPLRLPLMPAVLANRCPHHTNYPHMGRAVAERRRRDEMHRIYGERFYRSDCPPAKNVDTVQPVEFPWWIVVAVVVGVSAAWWLL